MKYIPLWTSVTGLVVLTVFYLKTAGNNEHHMLDLSTWNEDNIRDLESMALAIKQLEVWPKYSKSSLNKESSNRNRRRLTEDKWAQEEREMQEEIATFYEGKKVLRGRQRASKGITNLRISDEKRKLQDLPPISSNCTNPSASLPCPIYTSSNL